MRHPIKEIDEILEKCAAIRENDVDSALSEMSIKGILEEAIDQKDVDKVSKAIDQAADGLMSILNFMDSINFDTNKIGRTMSYMESMIDALKKARGELAAASFDSGAVSSFLGQKVTLPQITQAAIAIQTKANDFGTGFAKAVKNISNNLAPLLKDKDTEAPLKDIAGQDGIPDEDALRKGIKSAMTKSLGGGFFKKVKSFFSKSLTGKEKKIMAEIPDVDMNELAEEITDAFLESPMKAFLAKDIKEPAPQDQALSSVASEAQDQEMDQGSGETKADADSDVPAVKDEEEAKEEQEQAQQELVNAVKDEADEPQAPADAALGAIDTWANSLSKTSQSSLKAAGRLGSLKDIVKQGLEDASKAVEAEVSAAIEAWRDDNEETLVKGKRFAKKNFDSLQNLVPKLAGAMLKKSNESRFSLTKESVHKVVREFLDKKFYKEPNNVLTEYNYTEDEMRAYRLNKLAGLE